MRFRLGLPSSLLALVGISAGVTAVPATPLPITYAFSGLALRDGALEVFGTTAASVDAAKPTCVAGGVDPRTLSVGAVTEGSCENPALSVAGNGTVLPIVHYRYRSMNATVQIAVRDPQTGSVHLGAPVMTFEASSDTGAEWTFGDGWLWLYDVATTAGPLLERISPSTGAVAARIATPKLYRPILATDLDGLWLAVAPNGASSEPSPIYRVPVSSSSPILVRRVGASALFIVGSGPTVWVDVQSFTRSAPGKALTLHRTLWRFGGRAASGVVVRTEPDLDWGAALVSGSNTLVTLATSPNASCTVAPRLVAIDGSTGTLRTLAASFPGGVLGPCLQQSLSDHQGVVDDGFVYLLGAESGQGTFDGIYRYRL